MEPHKYEYKIHLPGDFSGQAKIDIYENFAKAELIELNRPIRYLFGEPQHKLTAEPSLVTGRLQSIFENIGS